MTEPLGTAAAAYALGAADESTRRAIDVALATDQRLADDVASFRDVVALLGLAAPSVAPPVELRTRVVGTARQVRPLHSSASQRAPATGQGSRLLMVVPWMALAASLAGLTVVYRGLTKAQGEAESLAAAARSLQAQLSAADSVLATVLAPDVKSARLASSGTPPGARLYWNAEFRRVVFAAWQLPPAAAGRTYQLWAIASGKPVSLGTFNSNPEGAVRATFEVPPGVEIATGAVTEEPAGGSPQPTSAPFLVGQVVGG